MTILDDPEDRVDLRSQTMEEENRKHKRKGKGEGEKKKEDRLNVRLLVE